MGVAPLDGRDDVAPTDTILALLMPSVELRSVADGLPVAAASEVIGLNLVRITPEVPLLAGESYSVVVSSDGTPVSIFNVVGGQDTTPPVFQGVDDARFFVQCSYKMGSCDVPASFGRLELDYILATDDVTPDSDLLYTYELFEEEDQTMPWMTFHRLGTPFSSSPDPGTFGIVADPIAPNFQEGQRYCARVLASDLSGNTSGQTAIVCGPVEVVGCVATDGAANLGCGCRVGRGPGSTKLAFVLVAVLGVCAARRVRLRRS